MRLSFLVSHPSSTYNLIRLWCKSMSKTFLISFIFIYFLENSKMSGDLWWALSLLLGCFMMFIFLFISNMATWGGEHHYWVIFRHKARWPLKRALIHPDPLSRIPKNHCASPQLCLFILSGQYPHCGPYKWNYRYLWPPFNPIGLNWA
jgi:hypothetical protein